MKGIVKRFGGVLANDHVDFSVKRGEIHALLGENGAGKSTVMSLLTGIYRADGGETLIHGRAVRIASPRDAMALGIGMVHQSFRLVPTLTALENIILGERGEVWRGSSWRKRKLQEIDVICSAYGLQVELLKPVWSLSVGEQQRVEIIKTLYRGADIILLDEPTSVLTPGEAEVLFKTLQDMKKSGKTMVITTHKLKEVMAVADAITIMRRGKTVAECSPESTSAARLAELMVGPERKESLPLPPFQRLQPPQRLPSLQRPSLQHPQPLQPPRKPGDIVLAVDGMKVANEHGGRSLDGVSLQVREGEIVGIAGVAGNGQLELAEALTGLKEWMGGQMLYLGKRMERSSVRERIREGIAHVPENRMKSGLAGSLGIVDNLLLKSYDRTERSRFGLLRKKSNLNWAQGLVARFDVRAPDLESPVRQLSGGNQQKLLLAREISQQPKLMVAVHPTQGLDVGAAEAVHAMLLKLRGNSAGVLLISEDLDEVMSLSDRIFVMYNGTIVGEADGAKPDREQIGRMMAGLNQSEEEAVV
jgi:simple sugar transport system ATP-binding protein